MLQDVPFPLLAAAFGRGAHGLRQLALGRGLSPVRSERPLPRSIGRELTFDDDVSGGDPLRATLLSLTDSAVAGLRRKGLAARTVTLKVRFSTFHTVSRRRTLPRPVSAVRPLFGTVTALLDELDIGARQVRLVGVSVSGFTQNAFQLTLDDGWREVALGEAVDRVREKYGFRSLTLAGGASAYRRLEHDSPAQSFHPAAQAARDTTASSSGASPPAPVAAPAAHARRAV